MFNNLFGSPFSSYSNPFHSSRYYNQPRYNYQTPLTRNYYDSDSTDSDNDYYYQPQSNYRPVGIDQKQRPPQTSKMECERKLNNINQKQQKKQRRPFYLWESDSSSSESEYEEKKIPEKINKQQQQKQQPKQYNQQPSKQQAQAQTQQKTDKQTINCPQKSNTYQYEQFFQDPKQVVNGISIECDVTEDDFPDFYASVKKSRNNKTNQIVDNYIVKLSPLGEIIEKQMQQEQLQACQ